jgi:hypothetical protein
VDRELAELAEHKSEQSDEILSHDRGQAQVALCPEIEVMVHSEVSSPGVIINGAKSMVEICPCHR